MCADIRRTVEIVFGAKSEMGQAITGISRDFNALNAVVESIANPLANIGKGILATDAALAALAVGGMALALKASSDFNLSFGLISTSVSATGSDLSSFRQDVLNYANGSVKSISDINAALYTAVQAGVEYGDSIDFIRKSEELAVANKANLNTTVDLLTATMNAYGMKMTDLAHINDVYFTSTLIGKQTIDELGASMGQVVTIAANSGVSFEELSAAVATMTAKGIETSTAITALRGVITTFTNPSEEARKAAAALGIDLSYASLHSQGLAGALNDVMVKTGGSTEKMIGLFTEMRAMTGVTALAGDGMKFFNEALSKINDSAGSAEAAYQKMVGTFSNQAQMLKNQATTLLVELGTQLEPIATNIGSGISTLISGIKIAVDSGAFQPLFDFLNEVTKDVGTWIADIGKAFPDAMQNIDFSLLIEAFRNLGQALREYFGGLDLTDVDDLSQALQTVVNVLTGLVNITAGMAEAFRPFIQSAAEFLTSVADSGSESQEAMGKVMAFAIAIQELGLGLAAAIIAINEFQVSISGLFNMAAGITQVLWNGFQILIDGLKGAAILISGFFVDFIDQITFGFFPGLDAAKEKLTKWGESIGPAFEQNGLDAARGLDTFAKGIAQLTTDAGTGKNATDNLSNSLNNVPKETKPEIILYHEEAKQNLATFTADIVEVAKPKTVNIGVQADGSSISIANNLITQVFPDGRILMTKANVATDPANLSTEKTKLDSAIPDKKQVDIEAKLNAEQIKLQAEVIKTAIEWKAKLDIAEVEANADKVVAIVNSVGESTKGAAQALSSIFANVDKLSAAGIWSYDIIEMIEDQVRIQNEALAIQRDLAASEIEWMNARTQAVQSGSSVITIDGKGLQPHLEAFMFEILSAIQVRANAEGQKFLLGL